MAVWRSDFVFGHFGAHAGADDFIAFFQIFDAAHVNAYGRVKFKRQTAGGGFRVAEHHADFLAQLVNKNNARFSFVEQARQFAQSLAHQSCLQTDVRVAHFAFDFSFRHERGHGVHHDQINRAGADQFFGDFQRLFAGIGLRDQQFVHIHAQMFGVHGVERVFRVDKRHGTAHFLGLRRHV